MTSLVNTALVSGNFSLFAAGVIKAFSEKTLRPEYQKTAEKVEKLIQNGLIVATGILFGYRGLTESGLLFALPIGFLSLGAAKLETMLITYVAEKMGNISARFSI